MDHVLKALDEHIAHQDWLLKCARQEIDSLRDELKKAQAEAEKGSALPGAQDVH